MRRPTAPGVARSSPAGAEASASASPAPLQSRVAGRHRRTRPTGPTHRSGRARSHRRRRVGRADRHHRPTRRRRGRLTAPLCAGCRTKGDLSAVKLETRHGWRRTSCRATALGPVAPAEPAGVAARRALGVVCDGRGLRDGFVANASWPSRQRTVDPARVSLRKSCEAAPRLAIASAGTTATRRSTRPRAAPFEPNSATRRRERRNHGNADPT